MVGRETVLTVVTRAETHNQVIIHPELVRVNARLQGFTDQMTIHVGRKMKMKNLNRKQVDKAMDDQSSGNVPIPTSSFHLICILYDLFLASSLFIYPPISR